MEEPHPIHLALALNILLFGGPPPAAAFLTDSSYPGFQLDYY
jgi:hypothetical protein